jgi:hypothetical protein
VLKDIGSWLVIGSIEVSAAATGNPLYGLTALAGNQLLDVPKLKDFPRAVREMIETSRKVRRSPVGSCLPAAISGTPGHVRRPGC